MAEITTPILVVGGGPIGLTLAMDLAWRGVGVTVVEQRPAGTPPSVKCNHTSARSMEIFRRLGVATKLRDAGLPADYPNDCSYRTTTTGIELARIPIPCRRDRYTSRDGPDTHWPTPEPPHRINQIFLEPVLNEHAATLPGLDIRYATTMESFTQDADSVTAICTGPHGERVTVRADYMVGCDGGRSPVRHAIGAKLTGTPVVQRVQSSYIRATRLKQMLGGNHAWVMFSLNPRRCGNVMAIDGRETWLVHNYLLDEEPGFDSVDRGWAIRTILGVGDDFEYQVLGKEDWIGRRLVADRFRDRRVFICGDAAHLWVPYAGYGMNAGIADAANLAWLLAARVQGWGGPAVLDGYEAERLPITEQVSHFAMNHSNSMARQRASVPAHVEEDSDAGRLARQALGRAAYDLNVQQYCCGGLNFGYFYDRSPLVVYDGEPHPGYTMADFTPSTVPGCRVPHFWLRDGRSLYDALGRGYTLLQCRADGDGAPFIARAAARGIPVDHLDVSGDTLPGAYRHRYVLARPDQHVAWRGDRLPDSFDQLLDTISGAAPQGAALPALAAQE